MTSRKRKRIRNQRPQKRLSFEGLEVRRLLASDWQNPGQVWDVSRDLTVSPVDALLGINRLNSGISRTFPARAAGSTEPFFDVSGDGLHSPLDVLLVINAINRNLPTVSVELSKDSGTGAGASLDRRTSDLSLRGNISRGRATELWGRYAGATDWQLLKSFSATSSDQTFTIPHTELIAALGLPVDSLLTLQFQPRFGANNAEVGNEADLPVTFDRTPPQFNFEAQPNFLGPILTPPATTIKVPLNERASSSTLLASKVKLFNATFSSLSTPDQELSASAVSLSSDGRFLLIVPPANSQSITYRVAIQEGAFEDLAGNLNVAFETLAHSFSKVSQAPLDFGQKLDFSATQPTVKEYTFDLSNPDLFLLAGLNSTGAMKLDLFSPSGQIVRNWATDADGGSLQFDAPNRAMLTELGTYTLRIAAWANTSVSFKALLSKQLTNVPASSQLTGTFTWSESQAFAVNVTNQDRIYFANNFNPATAFHINLLNQYGQEISSTDLPGGDSVFTVPRPGRYIVLIETVTSEVPVSYDYNVHLSQTIVQSLSFGQFQQNTLTTPGQQVVYTFAAQAARTYTLDIDPGFADISISLPGVFEVNQPGEFAVEASDDGFILVALNRADIASASSRFRLSEKTTNVTPPAVPTVHTEILTQGVTQRTIQLEQESYEFTFAGTTGELFAFRESDPINLGLFDVVAPTGSVVQPTENVEGLRIYRIPYSGQYLLRALGDVGTELSFQWQKLATSTVLTANANVDGSFAQESFAAYRFVANSSRFFVYPTAPADNLMWKLVDDNGQVIEESDLSQDFAADVTSGRAYTLIVEKLDETASSQFKFSRRNPVNAVRTGFVGTANRGDLLARGDRVVIEYSLVAGQLIDLASNLDSSTARVRWLDFSINEADGPLDIDPNVPTLVGSTRKYRVEIQNLTDATVSYSVKFDLVQPPALPTGTLSGFDQIQTGTVGSVPQVFTFDVSAGTYYMFDWLLEDNPNLQIEITDPSGNNINSLPAGTDSSLAVAEADGVLTIQIVNFGASDQPFAFRMISPSTGENLTLGVKKSALVIPYGAAFFRIPLGSTTELFLESALHPDNSTALYRLNSRDPLVSTFEGPIISGQFLVGEALVWAKNSTAGNYSTEFTPISVVTLPEAQLNSPVILQTVPDVRYVVPFKTTVANTIIGALGFEIVDEAGIKLEPILNQTAYQLKQAGAYRALLVASNATTQIELHTQVESNAPATLATPIIGTIDKLGDVKRYSITLTAGTPILLTLEVPASGFAQWIAPNGAVYASLFSGSRVLPVYLTGTYQLEVYSRANATSFQLELNDVSQASAIAPGSHIGNTGTGLVEINRLTATANQLMELQDTSANGIQLSAVDRLGKPLTQVSFANRIFNQVPADGQVYLLAQSFPGEHSVDFSYIVDLVSTQSLQATIGQPITGTLASRLEGKTYKFTVAQPTWLRVANVASNSALLVLKMADGSLRSSPEGFFELVLAGDYEVGIYNDSRSTNNFTMTIDLLSTAPVVALNQTTTVNKAGRYRVDISTSGRFELQLQNTNNVLLDPNELTVTELNGTEVSFNPRGSFEAGSYWVSFSQASTLPAGNYNLKVAPITTTESALAVGSLGEFTLNANGLQEHLVTIELTPGMRLLVDELQLGSGGTVEVRFNGDVVGDWSSLEQLQFIFSSTTGGETLQFRVGGTGLVRLHVLDLNVAPTLTLGTTTSIDLDARRRGQAWQIGGNPGDIVDFINETVSDRPVLWMIVDEVGNFTLKDINDQINFAIVNRQRLALVVIATEPLTATFKVPFRTVVVS